LLLLKTFADSCDRTLEDDGSQDIVMAITKRDYNKVKNQNQKGLKERTCNNN